MIDYEKLAEGVEIPQTPPEAPFDLNTMFESDLSPEAVEAARAKHVSLPLTHDKYQGIGAAKGYAQGDDFSGTRLKRVHYSHEAMIDVILAEPTITQNELAKRFDRSVSWMSIVMGSDSFQAALAKRRDDVVDPFLVATIEERFRGLAQQSLAIISEKLEQTQNLDAAFKALDISAKALGFGARTPSGPANQLNFVVQLPPKMANSSEWAKAHGAGPIIDQ